MAAIVPDVNVQVTALEPRSDPGLVLYPCRLCADQEAPVIKRTSWPSRAADREHDTSALGALGPRAPRAPDVFRDLYA
ncbi:hypothetical protein GCM10023083_08050 [Streptomyces phyllanthi]